MMNIPRFFLLALSFWLSAFCAQAQNTLVVYPDYPSAIERDDFYRVSVTQDSVTKPLVVWNHCEKDALRDRTYGGDVNRRFCEFAFEGGPVRIDIAVGADVESYNVFPSAKRFRHSFTDGVISVWLDKPDYFGVRINDYDKTILSVFADAPETDVPAKDKPGCLFVDGWLEAPGRDGVLPVADDVKEIYIAPGAVLNARLRLKAKGMYLHGRGMILDPMSDVFRYDQTQNTRRGLVAIGGIGTKVEGVKLVDARTFNITCWADGAVFRNVKLLATMMCSDGFTNGGKNPLVEHSWVYVGDNALVVSGVRDAVYRDVTIGTTCKAVFPQSTNRRVLMEDINVFRADEGLVGNEYNGVLRRNNKWNEMNGAAQKREPGPQDLKHQENDFVFKRLSAVDCGNISWLFRGQNMGTLPKTFVFEDCVFPHAVGVSGWRNKGKSLGPVVIVRNDPKKWLVSSNFVVKVANCWYDGRRLTSPTDWMVQGEPGELELTITGEKSEPAIPAFADVVSVGWRFRGKPAAVQVADANLVAEKLPRHSVWSRFPSWMTKFEATERDEKGAAVYHLVQCEKNAGVQAVVTEGFKSVGNGHWVFSGEVKLSGDSNAQLELLLFSNETRYHGKPVALPCDDAWHPIEFAFDTAFDLAHTELVALNLRSTATAEHIRLRNISFIRR